MFKNRVKFVKITFINMFLWVSEESKKWNFRSPNIFRPFGNNPELIFTLYLIVPGTTDFTCKKKELQNSNKYFFKLNLMIVLVIFQKWFYRSIFDFIWGKTAGIFVPIFLLKKVQIMKKVKIRPTYRFSLKRKYGLYGTIFGDL